MDTCIWTVRRTAGTLRTSNKEGRPPQTVVAHLKGYEETEIPEKMIAVSYDTVREKKGKIISKAESTKSWSAPYIYLKK